ncbi:MAG: tripartite tricarboxylate transporter TctB family protein, partial [Deltaproteobacteria bacterium]|nr:tripartite tricarboxylate transporter TctB family protein [Deltaproteobacteria bacterium]
EKVITFFTAVTYISVLHVVGFFAASFLFILLYVWGFERRGFLRPLLVAAACAGGAYIVFQMLLSVSFPRGFLM